MRSENSERQSGANLLWNLLLISLTGVGGYLWLSQPLRSSRPDAATAREHPAIGAQDVQARLWQDPLEAAYRHHQRSSAREDHVVGRHSPQVIREQIAERAKGAAGFVGSSPVLILPAMVRGGPYAEDAELRVRMRYAVTTALLTSGYIPEDSMHLGALEIPFPRRIPPNGERDQGSLIVAYEWFERDPLQHDGRSSAHVLVLWLPDESFVDKPLARLGLVFQKLLRVEPWTKARPAMSEGGSRCAARLAGAPHQEGPLSPDDAVTIRIIGPAGSTTLRAMWEDDPSNVLASPTTIALRRPLNHVLRDNSADAVTQANDGTIVPSSPGMLPPVTVYSPYATAPDALLLYELLHAGDVRTCAAAEDQRLASPQRALFPLHAPTPGYERTIRTDDELICELIEELGRRGVDVRTDPVMLVSESDTFYGRALPQIFATAVRSLLAAQRDPSTCNVDLLTHRHYQQLVRDPQEWPRNVYAFGYLQGVDGQIPRLSAQTGGLVVNRDEGNQNATSRQFPAPAIRRPEGAAQFDYVRRLSSLFSDHGTGGRLPRPKAVGVLGSDVYDKLLLLQALRSRFPNAIFFTTDLDQRMLHPDELANTRNMIVAAPFGLRPDADLLPQPSRRELPLFRDSYQTAVFWACIWALEGRTSINANLPPPKLYEIGRHGPYELTDTTMRPRKWGELALTTLALLVGSVVFLSLIPSFAARFLRAGDNRSGMQRSSQNIAEQQCGGRLRMGLRYVVLGGIAFAIGLMALIAVDHHRVGGEPFSIWEGISIWPTEAIRLCALFLSVVFLCKAHGSLERSADELEKTYLGPEDPETAQNAGAPAATSARGPKNPPGNSAKTSDRTKWWKLFDRYSTWRRPFSISTWQITTPEPDFAQVWSEYRERGRLPNRLRRIVPFVLGFFLFGILLIKILGAPHVPYRGWPSWLADQMVIYPSVLLMLVLIFYVVDATRLCARFIAHLASGKTQWPSATLTKLAAKDTHRRGAFTEWLDVGLIGKHTEVVDRLIYFPVVIVVLIMVSRVSIFDNWGFPTPIVVLIAINLGLAFLCLLLLRRAAANARRLAVERLVQQRLAAAKDAVDPIDFVLKRIERYRVGAYAPLSQQPLVQAILLPTGGFGAWAMLEYFAFL